MDSVPLPLSTNIWIIDFPTTGREDMFVPLVPSSLHHLARVRLVLFDTNILNHPEARERQRERRDRERETMGEELKTIEEEGEDRMSS
jgi:hypothetical protein